MNRNVNRNVNRSESVCDEYNVMNDEERSEDVNEESDVM